MLHAFLVDWMYYLSAPVSREEPEKKVLWRNKDTDEEVYSTLQQNKKVF